MQANRPSDFTPHILILDVEQDIRRVLIDLLTPEGYCVDGVGCGEEAFERMCYRRYSSILVNASIFYTGGCSILQRLKEGNPNTPIIVLTGYLTEEMTMGLIRKGAFAYLAIPYSAFEIKAALQRAVAAFQETLATENKPNIETT